MPGRISYEGVLDIGLRFGDRDRGWSRIADLYTKYGHPVADLVKIPHHGSAGADCDEMWDRLLRDRPVAALTAFRRGAVALPTAADVTRICENVPTYTSRQSPVRGGQKSAIPPWKRASPICFEIDDFGHWSLVE